MAEVLSCLIEIPHSQPDQTPSALKEDEDSVFRVGDLDRPVGQRPSVGKRADTVQP